MQRFRVPIAEAEAFRSEAEAALAVLAVRPGFRDAELERNLDEPELWVLVTRWEDVGSYRRALGSYEVRVGVVPLLSRALDEPSAYEDPDLVGENRPRS